MLDLQLSDKNTLGTAIVTRQKLRTLEDRSRELNYRAGYLHEKAPHDGIYLPRLPGAISAGMFLPKGSVIAEVVSTEKIVYAYADDRDVSKLSIGDRVLLRVRDSLIDHYGLVMGINSVPAKLRNSPLLQQYGGPIPVYVDEHHPGEFTSILPLYRIEIMPEGELPFQTGRNLMVEIIHTERLYDTLSKYTISIFRKEF